MINVSTPSRGGSQWFTRANVKRLVKFWNPFCCDWHHNELFGETVTARHRPVSYLVCTNLYSLSHFVTFSWNCGEVQWDGQYSNHIVAKCNSSGATFSNTLHTKGLWTPARAWNPRWSSNSKDDISKTKCRRRNFKWFYTTWSCNRTPHCPK